MNFISRKMNRLLFSSEEKKKKGENPNKSKESRHDEFNNQLNIFVFFIVACQLRAEKLLLLPAIGAIQV